MPLYEFLCRDCEVEQELLVRGEEQPVCEKCGSKQLVKLLSVCASPASNSAGNSPDSGPMGGGGGCGMGCGCHP
ncbi:MAG: hypothetical protein KDA61_02380 [Planctomycetales bacterium]|nr:hypothetical protein [Planctomycetales bacterium]